MADKPRTPDPPRKVQAPKVRQKHAPAGGGMSMPGTNTYIGIGLLVIAGLVAVLLVVLSRGGSAANITRAEVRNVQTAMESAGCSFTEVPAAASQQHMSAADEKVRYSTFPPATGVHNPTPALWGNYRLPSDPRQVVHNLEHGGIAIWYGPRISAADRGALDSFYDDSPNAMVITPLADSYPNVTYPKHEPLGSKIGLSVWTSNTKTAKGTAYVAVCPSFNAKAFAAFRDTFRGKGPERFPVSRLTPGS